MGYPGRDHRQGTKTFFVNKLGGTDFFSKKNGVGEDFFRKKIVGEDFKIEDFIFQNKPFLTIKKLSMLGK